MTSTKKTRARKTLSRSKTHKSQLGKESKPPFASLPLVERVVMRALLPEMIEAAALEDTGTYVLERVGALKSFKGFGTRIRQIRQFHGLTLQEFAQHVNETESMISMVENEKRPVSISLLIKISICFKIKPRKLFEGWGEGGDAES